MQYSVEYSIKIQNSVPVPLQPNLDFKIMHLVPAQPNFNFEILYSVPVQLNSNMKILYPVGKTSICQYPSCKVWIVKGVL